MAGRRAFPYSVEAEDQLTPRAGRRKVLWRDRPKHFGSLLAAGTFAAHHAGITQRRQRVRLEKAGTSCWTVRPTSDPIGLRYQGFHPDDRQLIASLDRMAREA